MVQLRMVRILNFFSLIHIVNFILLETFVFSFSVCIFPALYLVLSLQKEHLCNYVDEIRGYTLVVSLVVQMMSILA